MSTSDDALRSIVDEMVLVLAPLVDAAQAPDDFTRLLAELGWTVTSVPRPLRSGDCRSEPARRARRRAGGASDRAAAHVDREPGRAIDAIRAQADSEFPDGVDIASFKQTIGRDLLDYCVVGYLLGRGFKFGRLLKLMGIIQLIETPASGLRQTFLKRYVNWAGVGLCSPTPSLVSATPTRGPRRRRNCRTR